MVNPKVQATKAHEASRRLKGIADPLSTQPVELPSFGDLSEEEIRDVLEDNLVVLVFSRFGLQGSGVVMKDEARLVRIMLEMATERAKEIEKGIVPLPTATTPNKDDIQSWKNRIKG